MLPTCIPACMHDSHAISHATSSLAKLPPKVARPLHKLLVLVLLHLQLPLPLDTNKHHPLIFSVAGLEHHLSVSHSCEEWLARGSCCCISYYDRCCRRCECLVTTWRCCFLNRDCSLICHVLRESRFLVFHQLDDPCFLLPGLDLFWRPRRHVEWRWRRWYLEWLKLLDELLQIRDDR